MKHPTDKNRAYWNRASDEYQELHGTVLERTALAWGVWRIPEAELCILGDTSGRDVLELGCGAAQWAVDLRRSGARVVGVDFSREQLRHASLRAKRHGLELPLVGGDAERLPFRDRSFDVVFCDHGAMSFAPPHRTVPEAARVLRDGGLFAFCTSSPFRDLCWDEEAEDTLPALAHGYFDLGPLEDEETVTFQLPYGEWIRLFRRNGLLVEDLVELRPPEGATTTYDGYVPLAWARRWPAENIWKLRKSES